MTIIMQFSKKLIIWFIIVFFITSCSDLGGLVDVAIQNEIQLEGNINKINNKDKLDIDKQSSIKIIDAKIQDNELKNLVGINNKMLSLLAQNNIVTIDNFADLASFELIDKEEGIFKDLDIDENVVNNMIMKAREKWFTEEPVEEVAKAEAAKSAAAEAPSEEK